MAVLSSPVVLFESAARPTAVLPSPTLLTKANDPLAVLSLPVVLLKSALAHGGVAGAFCVIEEGKNAVGCIIESRGIA